MLRAIGRISEYNAFCIFTRLNGMKSHNFTRNKNHYATLGISPNATQEEIKAAYYELSFKYHPDRNSGCDLSASKFREVAEAYETLSNLNDFDPRNSVQWKRFYKERSKAGTGRTNKYNYDEHYYQHYEKDRFHTSDKWKQQQSFRSRSPFNQSPDGMIQKRNIRTFILLWFLLGTIALSSLSDIFFKLEKPRGPIYYDKKPSTKNEEE